MNSYGINSGRSLQLVQLHFMELDFPQSDCMVAFDNDQVVGKSWCVSIDNKVKSSCVTSICAVAIDTGSCNFSNKQLKIANHPKKVVQLHWICTKT